MHTILIAGRKGGVGKTTVAVTLADGLARLGLSTVLIDTDPQGHCSESLGLPESDGLYDAITGRADLQNLLQQHSEHLHVLPSSDRTSRIVSELPEDGALAFVELLDQISAATHARYAIIDTAPTTSPLDALVWLGADYHLYVTRLARLAFDGVVKISEQATRFAAQRQRFLGRQTKLLGIVPNMMNIKTTLHRHNLQALVEAYPGLVWPPIAQRTAWEEATSFSQTIFEYAPNSQAAHDAAALIEHVLQEVQG